MEHRSTLFSKSISYCNSYFIPIIIVRSNVNTCSFYGFYQLLKFLQTISISARCGNCVFCVNGCGGSRLWNARRAIARCSFFRYPKNSSYLAAGSVCTCGARIKEPSNGYVFVLFHFLACPSLIFVPSNRPVAYLLQT